MDQPHHRSSPRPAAIAPMFFALIAILLSACGEHAGQDVASAGAGATWRWRAEKMEVSALTTPIVARVGRSSMIDARIAFYDSERDETKALGELTVLVRFDGNEIGRQSADLAGVGGHARAWDSVTETYSMRIPLSIDPPPGRIVVLQATFDGVDGARMTASREVRWPETAR
ncbi:MAG: hypothetical protein NT059_05265 [Planctomycetota bacterium]|nr:hypothetical protein [Planctomycetota bacterium]